MNRARSDSSLGPGLLLALLDGHDVQLPAGELGGELHVLAELADRDGLLVLLDDHVHRVALLVDDDGAHLRRRQCVDHELRRVRRPQDDVDALAGQLLGHRLHARAAHADAGADGVDARIVRLHRDLGAQARIAGGGLDLEQALLDLRHLELEELHEEFGGDARQDELRPARLAVDLVDVGAHAVADAQVFLGDQVVARQQRLDAARFDDEVAALGALHRAGHERLAALEEVVEDLLALGVADLLQDHLLGGLRADAPEGLGLERLLEDVAQLGLGVLRERVGDRDLVGGLLVLLVGHDRPAAERACIRPSRGRSRRGRRPRP